MDESEFLAKARETGFCLRNRKVSPRHFLEMLLCKVFSARQQSLTDHAIDLQLSRNVEIRKQSLHEKFTPQAVSFIKSLISDQFSKQVALPSPFLKMFPAIYIQDSTRFGLPESLREDYPGYGGRGAKAGAKIEFVYDLKTHQMHHHSLKAVTENDLTDSKHNHWITEGSLILRDMGYYSHEGLHEIIKKKAFFISRVRAKTALFEITGERLDLNALIKKMKRNGITCMEKQLRIGNENSFLARVIICLVPDHVKKKRKQEAIHKAKNHQSLVQKQHLVWQGINMFITNVNRDCLAMDQIMTIYRLRWQVELAFKTWKSHHNIDQYKSMKKERMECYVYASLLLILLQGKIFAWLNQKLIANKIHLSLHKFSKLMVHLHTLFNEVVIRNKLKISNFLSCLLPLAQVYALKEKKDGKIGFADIIQIKSSVSCNDKQNARHLSHKNSGLKKYEISTLVGWDCFILS